MVKLLLSILLLLQLFAESDENRTNEANIESAKTARIGVLALRGEGEALLSWNESAKYLSENIAGYNFEIVPLPFDSIEKAIENREIDFLLANSSIYVRMESKYKISRIATIKREYKNGINSPVFGGVIFVQKDSPIKTLEDARGSLLGAVDYTSLGGYQMALGEVAKIDTDYRHFFKDTRFYGTHDEVVYALMSGEVAIGTVRSGIIENLIAHGMLDSDAIRIINKKQCEDLPLLVSTICYPEWPIAKLAHTPDLLANRVATTLIQLEKNSTAAAAAQIAGWSVPYNYRSVHDLLQTLKVAPYDKEPEFSLVEIYKKYSALIITVAISILLGLLFIIYILYLNSKLKKKRATIEQNLNELKAMQKQLIESEKLASLGSLVAGVAHEINTPLGSAIMSCSILNDECKKLRQLYESELLDEKNFLASMESLEEAEKYLEITLNKAAKLVRNFKEISVDQSSDEKRRFNLKNYIEDIVGTFKNMLKKIPVEVTLKIDEHIEMETYAGSLSQVVGNLIHNSIIHAFENSKNSATITIEAKIAGEACVVIFQDNGVGIDKSIRTSLFEPFVTTKRDHGGSGLGLNIVYNLTRQKLGGIISLEDSEIGAKYRIEIPLKVADGKSAL